MARKWKGVICVEGVQTGDGRIIAAGALTWPELPIPLGLLPLQQHGDGMGNPGGPVIGTIAAIAREGSRIVAEGEIDDTDEMGAEVCRKMDEGLAPLGAEYGVSIDPDNWTVEIVETRPERVDEINAASTGEDDHEHAGEVVARMSGAAGRAFVLTAAAGDGDPTDGVVMFEDTVDGVVQRYTALRIRGATLCAIAAFDEARISLVAAATTEEAPPEPVTAATPIDVPVKPPAAWFSSAAPDTDDDDRLVEQFDIVTGEFIGLAVPLTIVTSGPDAGMVYGSLAPKDRCHVGYDGVCVVAPAGATGYSHFLIGATETADAGEVATGALLVGCDHASHLLDAEGARDHYANTSLAWADVTVRDSKYGPWFCGALRPNVTQELVRALKGGGVSGDWRGDTGVHELLAVQAVSTPGFTVQRVRPIAASATSVELRPWEPYLEASGGRIAYSSQPMLAAGIAEHCGCGGAITAAGGLAEVLRLLHALEARTRPLNATRVARAQERLADHLA